MSRGTVTVDWNFVLILNNMKTITVIAFTLLTLNTMAAKKEISTQIIINASPEKVWTVLTDFDTYSDWNPFIKSIKGNVNVGNKINILIDGMKFKPEVLVYESNQEFKWIGNLLVKGLFDGEHRFQLIDNGDGTTTFIQSEKFNGILVNMLSKKLDNETIPGFEAMNLALKNRVESLN